MNLATIVQEQIRRFVVGLVSADDLSDWLDVHAQQVHRHGSTDVRRMTDRTFSLLEDVANGRRSESEARELLSADIPTTVSFSEAVTAAMVTTVSGVLVSVSERADFTQEWSPVTGPLTFAH